MARLTGPDAAERLCYTLRADNAIGTAAGLPAVFYSDAGGTTLANILTTGGAVITGSLLTVDATSLLPLFQYPDNVSTVYVSVNGGPVSPVRATIGSGGGGGGAVASVNGFTGAVTLGAADVGLPNVNNTADSAKPVSAAQATALALKADASALAGYATTSLLTSGLAGKADTSALSSKADLVGGSIPTSQLPALAVVDFLGTAANQTAMLALSGQKGDWAIRSDTGQTWVITGSNPAQLASWTALSTPAAPVSSINSQTGTVVLGKADVGLGSVDNTADASKPISTLQQGALDTKAAGAASSTDGQLVLFSGTTGKILKASAVGLDTNADMTGLRRLTRTLGTDPAVAGLQRTDLTYAVSTSSSDLERVYVSSVLTSWRNEVGFLRGTPHAGYKDDALVRAVPRSDLTTENGGFVELQNAARTQVLYKRSWRTGQLYRGDGTAAAIAMADTYVTTVGATLPTGLPAGTVIVRI